MEILNDMKTVKLFVLGRPGTGKSTAARHMVEIVREYGWHPQHISDYGILYSMYHREEQDKDKEKKVKSPRFKRASESLDGFDVVDLTVFDEALITMKQQVDVTVTRALDRMKLVIIEFARGTYKTSLDQFGRKFLQESYFLLLDSDIDKCMDRIEHRARHPIYEDDRFMSKEAMEVQFSSNAIPATRAMLGTVYKLDNSRIKVIYNLSTEEAFLNEVRRFTERIILKETGS